MVLINGEYLVDEVSEADVRWAMGLAVSALQGAAQPPRLGRLLQQGSRRTMHLIGTLKMIKDEIDI